MANESARQVLFIITAISIAVSVLCLGFKKPLLRLIFGSVEADVMRASETYFFYTAISFPFIAAYDSAASIFRAQENTKGPMLISMISNAMNIVGNAIMIWIFHMGVAGAAISTLVSRIFCAVVVLIQLRKDRQPIVVRDYLKIRPDWAMIRRILGIGIPSGVENSMFQLGKLAIQSTVSTLGTTAIAAQAMTNILENLNGMAAIGVGVGLMTIVGQCMGADRKDEAVYYIKIKCDRRSGNHCKLPAGICIDQACDSSWRHGAYKCKDVFPYGNLDYACEADCMDAGICSGIRTSCGGRRKIFYDHVVSGHVAVPILSVRDTDPISGIWTDGRLDRYVCRLDSACSNIYMEIP